MDAHVITVKDNALLLSPTTKDDTNTIEAVNFKKTIGNFEDNTTGEKRGELPSNAITQFDDLLTKIEDLSATFSMLSDSSDSTCTTAKTDTDTIEAVNFNGISMLEEEDKTEFESVVKDFESISATDSDSFYSTDDTSVESMCIIRKIANERNTIDNFEDNSTAGENIGKLSSNEKAEFDDLLAKIEDLSTTYSIVSDRSGDTSLDSISIVQNIDSDRADAANIAENEEIVEANNQNDYTDIEIATDFKSNEGYDKCKSINKLVNEHLSFGKVDRCSPYSIRTRQKSNNAETYEGEITSNFNNQSMLSSSGEKLKIDQRPHTLIESPLRQEESSVKSIFKTNSSTDWEKSGKRPKTVTWSSSTDIKDNNPNLDPYKNITGNKISTSEIAGSRLHLKATERQKRLALLRCGYKTSQPNLTDKDRSSTNLFYRMKKKKGVIFNIDSNRSSSQRQLSISEIAGLRLHSKAMERNKRLAIRRREYHTNRSSVVLKNASESLGCDVKSIEHASTDLKLNQHNWLDTAEAKKDHNFASRTQTNNIRSILDSCNNSFQKKLTFSDTNRYGIYSKATERNQMSRLFRNESCNHQTKFTLETILENRGTDTKGSKCDSIKLDHNIVEGSLPFPIKEPEKAEKKMVRQAEQKRQLKLKLKKVNVLDHKGHATKKSTEAVTRNVSCTKNEHQMNALSRLMPKKECNNFSPSIFQRNGGRSNRNLSFSEIAGYRLYTKAMERNERLALRRKEKYNHKPKLMLATASESRPNNIKCESKFQRLHALSHSMRKDKIKRSKEID